VQGDVGRGIGAEVRPHLGLRAYEGDVVVRKPARGGEGAGDDLARRVVATEGVYG
jgi:hypothetical protein